MRSLDLDMDTTLHDLQRWYLSSCNGNWEHSYGIKIETLDNPGWLFNINLCKTSLDKIEFKKIKSNRTEDDWVYCNKIEGNIFQVSCGPENLAEGLNIFMTWAKEHQNFKELKKSHSDFNSLPELQRWYLSNCDGDWEHSYGVTINTLDNTGWALNIELSETPLEDIDFENVQIKRTENDWVDCKVEDYLFKGQCSPENLEELIKTFIVWARKHQQFVDPKEAYRILDNIHKERGY